MRKIAIIQARMGSTRLPNKVLIDLAGKTMLQRVVDRVRQSRMLDDIVIATTTENSDQPIVDYCEKNGIHYSRGSESDVLARYYESARKFNAELIVRVTSDCPLFDASLMDQGIEKFLSGKYDYVTNVLPPTYPDGLDYSIISFAALSKAFHEAKLNSEREHVVPWIWKESDLKGGKTFKSLNLSNEIDYSGLRWTVDQEEDISLIRKVYEHFGDSEFNWKDVIGLLTAHPDWSESNSKIIRDAGYIKSLQNDSEVKK